MALHTVVPRFVVIVLREIIFVVLLSRRSRFPQPDLEPWCDGNYSDGLWQYLYLPLCTIVFAFQVTKIGGRGRDVLNHACQLTRGCLEPMFQPTCPWCMSTTQLTMGGRKRTASYFQFGPRCPSPRMCSTCRWSKRAQLPALSANAWTQSWSVHISASAHASNSWTRTVSNTNMYIGALIIFLLNALFKDLFQAIV